MPERNPTRQPDIYAGTILYSGSPNTGQIPYSFGGSKTYSSLSGVATDVLIQLGAGRLDNAQLIPGADLAASGLPVIFYDSHAAAAAGPVAASGHKIVGVIAPSNTASGNIIFGDKLSYGTVFTSGLCVYQISGIPGFTATYTPVVSG